MLISFARQRGLSIDFLIYVSTIFDAADPRQRAHAQELEAEMSKKYGFQFICTLNTDMSPVSDFTAAFDYKSGSETAPSRYRPKWQPAWVPVLITIYAFLARMEARKSASCWKKTLVTG